MSENENSEDGAIKVDAHITGNFRPSLKWLFQKVGPYIAVFMMGNGTAGAVLFNSMSPADMESMLDKKLDEKLKPLVEKIEGAQSETHANKTETDSRHKAYMERFAKLERRLSTRNRP